MIRLVYKHGCSFANKFRYRLQIRKKEWFVDNFPIKWYSYKNHDNYEQLILTLKHNFIDKIMQKWYHIRKGGRK